MNKHLLVTLLIYVFYFNQISHGAIQKQNTLKDYTIGKDFVKYDAIPNNAYVDKIHSLKSPYLTSLEKSLYAIRYLKTVELLRARKSLLELLAPMNRHLKRATPTEVLKIHPNNPQIKLLTNQLKSLILNAHNKRFNVHSYEEAFNQSLKSLSKVSSLLTVIDAKIYYLEKTIYKENNIKYRRVTKDFGIDRLIAKLLGQRAYILTKYPILGMTIGKNIFYKEIYQDLWAGQYYPKAYIQDAATKNKFYRRVIYNSVDKSRSTEPLEFIFEEKLSQKVAQKWGKFKIALVGESIRNMFTQNLVQALNANTIALKTINKSLRIKNSRNIFDILAMDKLTWSKLSSSFPYISKNIFKKGKEQYQKHLKGIFKKDMKKAKQTFWFGSGSIGLAVLIGIAGAGAIPVLLLSSAGALFFISKDYTDYTLYKEYKESAQNLYFAGKNTMNKTDLESLDHKQQEAVRSLFFSSMLTAVTIARPLIAGTMKLMTKSATQLSNTSRLTGKHLEKYIRLSRFKSIKYKNHSIVNKSNLLRNSPYYNKSINLISSNLKKISNLQAIKYLKKTGQSLKSAITNTKSYKELIKDELLLQTLGREIVIEIAAVLIGEYIIRGDKFWDEFHFVLMNTILSLGLISLIAVKGMKSKGLMWDEFYKKNYSSFLKIWGRQAKELALPTFYIGLAGNTSIEMMMHLNNSSFDDPEYMSIEDRMIRSLSMATFMAGFIGIASSARSEVVYKHANTIIDKGLKLGLTKTAIKNGSMNFLAELLKIPISFANNLVGTLASTTLARDLGLQVNKEARSNPDLTYMHYENNTYNHTYLYELPRY